jgi:hypothetical protein
MFRKKKNHTVANRTFVDNQVWQNAAANNTVSNNGKAGELRSQEQYSIKQR